MTRHTRHPSTASSAAGCSVPKREGRVYHSGGFIEPDRLWGQQTESGLIEHDVAQYTRTRKVQGIAFALAYIRRDCLDRAGALDTAFHSYFEDTDYCLRAGDLGIATVVAGTVTLRHDQHGSTTEHSEFRARLFETSRATFAARWQRRLAERYRGTLLWHGTTRASPVYARLARDYVRRLDARGLRAAFAPTRGELADPQDFRLELAAGRRWTATPDAAIVCASAPHFAAAHGRLRAGIGIAEWDRVPESEWARAANMLDRLIVPDAFQADAFRAAGVHDADRDRSASASIATISTRACRRRVIRRDHFVFLAVAEASRARRADVLIEAFLRAFAPDEPVELLVQDSPAQVRRRDDAAPERADRTNRVARASVCCAAGDFRITNARNCRPRPMRMSRSAAVARGIRTRPMRSRSAGFSSRAISAARPSSRAHTGMSSKARHGSTIPRIPAAAGPSRMPKRSARAFAMYSTGASSLDATGPRKRRRVRRGARHRDQRAIGCSMRSNAAARCAARTRRREGKHRPARHRTAAQAGRSSCSACIAPARRASRACSRAWVRGQARIRRC